MSAGVTHLRGALQPSCFYKPRCQPCSHVSSLCQDQGPPFLPLVWSILPGLVSLKVLACQFMGAKCPGTPLSCSS